MLRVLIVSTEEAPLSPTGVARFATALDQGGITALYADGNGTTEELRHACGGVLPDLLIADLRTAFDTMPLRHLRRRIAEAWQDNTAETLPPLLALFDDRHLASRDWL